MNIQVAPVFLERLAAIEAEVEAADKYYEAAAGVYMKNLVRLKSEQKEVWEDINREYNLSLLVQYEITRTGILQEIEAEKEKS